MVERTALSLSPLAKSDYAGHDIRATSASHRRAPVGASILAELFSIAAPPGAAKRHVIFVHGLDGDPRKTWRSRRPTWLERLGLKREELWPSWLAADIEELAVWTVGFPAAVSNWTGSAMYLTDRAANVFERLIAEDRLGEGELIFVGHSFGGLVIKELLRKASDEAQAHGRDSAGKLVERTRKVAFLATPHSGADLAVWLDRLRLFFRPSPTALSLANNDPHLRNLNQWYRRWAGEREIEHLVLVENETTYGAAVVKPDSADPGLSQDAVFVDANHISIAKPPNRENEIYIFVRNFVCRVATRYVSPEERAIGAVKGDTQLIREQQQSEPDQKIKRAQELMHEGGKGDEARKLVEEALTAARQNKNEKQEVQALIALVLFSSSRRGIGDREHYFRELEKKERSLKTPVLKALFYRAKAAFLLDKSDQDGADGAFKDALKVCASAPDDEKQNNGIQACVARADYIHLLCSQKRLDEAQAMLIPCEEYARANMELEGGALLHIALQAGIHLALEKGDQQGAIGRISELEASATSVRLADRVGGDLLNVANQCSHRDAHEAALLAAQAAIRLGRRAQDREGPSFLVGAFYTEAMVLMRAGNDALALNKAEAILDFCTNPEDAAVRQATHHLIAEIKRLTGDSETAVEVAQIALREARGGVEEIAFAKLALARALNDDGQTEEALKQARAGWQTIDGARLPAKVSVDFLSHIVTYASQLGLDEETREALAGLNRITAKSDDIVKDITRIGLRADMIMKVRGRIIGVIHGDGCLQDDPAKQCRTVQEGNAAILRPLLNWWDDIVINATPACITGAYEFWGRGNFVRVLENLRRFPRSLNITLEVRTLHDVKRAIRIWGMYADVLILLWKGPTESGWEQIVVPESFFVQPGGAGYMVFLDTKLKKEGSEVPWFVSLGHGTTLPAEVALFLATEARCFVESGRLIVLPAVGAACVSPGHGIFEQLIAQAANAVPGIRSRTRLIAPIGVIPHSPDIPLSVLADLVESEADRLRKLRLLLANRARADGNLVLDARALSLEIDDALAEMTDISTRVFSRRGLSSANEPLATTKAHFKSDGSQLSAAGTKTPFAPLFVLQTLGYGWQVGLPDQISVDRRYEPQDGDAIGSWLSPAEAGWSVPFFKKK